MASPAVGNVKWPGRLPEAGRAVINPGVRGRAARLGGATRAQAAQSAARPNRAEPERPEWATEQAEPSMHATEPSQAEGLNLLSLLSLLSACSDAQCVTHKCALAAIPSNLSGVT